MGEVNPERIECDDEGFQQQVDNVKIVSRGKFLSSHGRPADPSIHRFQGRLAISNRLGYLFQVESEGISAISFSDVELAAHEVEKVLLGGSSSSAKIKDAIIQPQSTMMYAWLLVDEEEIQGALVTTLLGNDILIAWSNMSVVCFEIATNPVLRWAFKVAVSEVASGDGSIAVLEGNAIHHVDLMSGSVLSVVKLDQPVLCAAFNTKYRVWAVGDVHGAAVLIKDGSVVDSVVCGSCEDPVQCHTLLWVNDDTLVLGLRGVQVDDDEPGSLPLIMFCRLGNGIEVLDSILFEDPLNFNSTDKPWEHKFYLNFVPHLNAVLVVSSWSRNMVLIGSSKDDFDWKILVVKSPKGDLVARPQILELSMFELDERPLVLGPNEDGDMEVQNDSLPLSATICYGLTIPMHPFYVYGEGGDLESKPNFSPSPALVVVSTDGIIEVFSLMDSDIVVPNEYPDMIVPLQKLPQIPPVQQTNESNQKMVQEEVKELQAVGNLFAGFGIEKKEPVFAGFGIEKKEQVFSISNNEKKEPAFSGYGIEKKEHICSNSNNEKKEPAFAGFGIEKKEPIFSNSSIEKKEPPFSGFGIGKKEQVFSNSNNEKKEPAFADLGIEKKQEAFSTIGKKEPTTNVAFSGVKEGFIFTTRDGITDYFKNVVPKSAPEFLNMQKPLASAETLKFRAILKCFYEKANPSKIPKVDSTIDQYKGKEMELFQKLQEKYGSGYFPSDLFPDTTSDIPIQENKKVDEQTSSVDDKDIHIMELQRQVHKLQSKHIALETKISELEKKRSLDAPPSNGDGTMLAMKYSRQEVSSPSALRFPEHSNKGDSFESEASSLLKSINILINSKHNDLQKDFARGPDDSENFRDKMESLKLVYSDNMRYLNGLDQADTSNLKKNLERLRSKLLTRRKIYLDQELRLKSCIGIVNKLLDGKDTKPDSNFETELLKSKNRLEKKFGNLGTQFSILENQFRAAEKQTRPSLFFGTNKISAEAFLEMVLATYRRGHKNMVDLREMNARLNGFDSVIGDISQVENHEAIVVEEKRASTPTLRKFKSRHDQLHDLATFHESLIFSLPEDPVLKDCSGIEISKLQNIPKSPNKKDERNHRRQLARNLTKEIGPLTDDKRAEEDSRALAFLESFKSAYKPDQQAQRIIQTQVIPPVLKTVASEEANAEWNPSCKQTEEEPAFSTIKKSGGLNLVGETALNNTTVKTPSAPSSFGKLNSSDEKVPATNLFPQSSSIGTKESSIGAKETSIGFKENSIRIKEEPNVNASSFGSAAGVARDFTNVNLKASLTQFYETHNPSNIAKIDQALSKYKGQYDNMLDQLEKKYKAKVKLVNGGGFGTPTGTAGFTGFASSTPAASFAGFGAAGTPSSSTPAASFAGFGAAGTPSGFGNVNSTPPPSQGFGSLTSTPSENQGFGNSIPQTQGFGNAAFGATTNAAPGNQDHRQRLTQFYQKYNPSKIASIDKTTQKYMGKETQLYTELEKKYGPGSTGFFQGGNQTIQGGGFSSFATTPSSFGSASQSGFGAQGFGSTQQPASGFGSTQQPASGFGSTQQPASGLGSTQQPASGFGSTQQPVSGFGSNSSAGFGSNQQPTSSFGAPTNQSPGAFGSNGFGNSGFANQSGIANSFGGAAPAPGFNNGSYSGSSFSQMRG